LATAAFGQSKRLAAREWMQPTALGGSSSVFDNRVNPLKFNEIMDLQIIDGDLLDQPVEVIVNAWNRNVFPWWLLLPQGVSRAIKKRAGKEPFRELGRMKMIPLGGAVETGPGLLPFKAIIHVAGINLLWRASEWSIRASVRNAIALAKRNGYQSAAFPLIGAGSGGAKRDQVLEWMRQELASVEYNGEVRIVRFKP
jgi:O-acetyl-ADP-ribose deacetylase (regulator of RNase III)